MTQLTLYGTPISTYVRTVRLLLEQAGTDYDLESVDIFNGENQSAEYLAKHPFGKVPTLQVDEEVIYETSAITGYLDSVVANHKFSPTDPLARARMQQIMAIIDSYLYAPVIGTIVIQRLIVPSQGGQPDESKIQAAIAPAKTALEAIEALTVGSPYLLGSEISIADFFLVPIFIYFSQTPEFNTITAQSPKIQAWWQEVSQLPVVKKVCA
ncbi:MULTISPECIES: glutathione S-transferase family protein [Trichocoleus]|uniref:Glutathione S-transferase family protein n=1 Tax=Trichocoleus desertorum GB2-A4 TaxID=2933944 RepID=A0ABV0J530_9CYAN|nr:glutathione S-transferase family protein [Trichocoleus sp. FACHB-46]MBD1863722.1 glutathione S-transferase family protein [Trichocoleus sp. FACHB-46]